MERNVDCKQSVPHQPNCRFVLEQAIVGANGRGRYTNDTSLPYQWPPPFLASPLFCGDKHQECGACVVHVPPIGTLTSYLPQYRDSAGRTQGAPDKEVAFETILSKIIVVVIDQILDSNTSRECRRSPTVWDCKAESEAWRRFDELHMTCMRCRVVT